MVGNAAGNKILVNNCAPVSLKLLPTLMSTRRVPLSPSMVLRITGGRPAANPIMMMVQALRPKITRNSGYISTVGADARAATQVSVAWRRTLMRKRRKPSETPTTVIIAPAVNASKKVRRNRSAISSSTMTRSKAGTICEGRGTMKRLITPIRISASTLRIAAASAPSPSASGNIRVRVTAATPTLPSPACGGG